VQGSNFMDFLRLPIFISFVDVWVEETSQAGSTQIHTRSEMKRGFTQVIQDPLPGATYYLGAVAYPLYLPYLFGDQTEIEFTVPELCSAGTSSETGYAPCTQSSSGAAPYFGPVISSTQQLASPGELVTLNGSALQGVTGITVGGQRAELVTVTDSAITLRLNLETPLGEAEVAIDSATGRLLVAGLINVVGTVQAESSPTVSVKRMGDRVRVFALDVVGAGKVQFFLNGREIAWVRAVDESDPKLRAHPTGAYLVRNRALAEGKNVIEIYVDGERVRRVAYTR